jgi:hypothetical protein
MLSPSLSILATFLTHRHSGIGRRKQQALSIDSSNTSHCGPDQHRPANIFNLRNHDHLGGPKSNVICYNHVSGVYKSVAGRCPSLIR